jgi:hypothetical protein
MARQLTDNRLAGHGSPVYDLAAAAVTTPVAAATPSSNPRFYQLFSACLLVGSSVTLVAAALSDSIWQARALSELIGCSGLSLLVVSLVCLIHSTALDCRQLTNAGWDTERLLSRRERSRVRALLGWASKDTRQPWRKEIVNHPMRDRLLDG